MDQKNVRILLIEDNPDDVFFLRMVLHKADGTTFNIEPVDDLATGIERVKQSNVDVVLLDLTLPDSVGLDTFKAIKAHAREVPIIVLSGVDDETIAVNAVHAGAEDYLVKGRVDSQLITRAIIYAIERTEARKAILRAEEKFRSIFENSVSGIFQTTPEGTYLSVNPALTRIYGYSSPDELISGMTDIARKLYVDPNRRTQFVRLMQEHGVVQDFESQVHRKDGSIIWIAENARAVRDRDGKILYYEGMVEDITGRKVAEERLRFSETRFRSVWENSTDGMRLTDAKGIILAVNPSYCQIIGMKEEDLVGRPFTVIYSETEDLPDMIKKYQQRVVSHEIETNFERHVTFRSGKTVDVETSNSIIEVQEGEPLVLSVFRDITIRKQAEERERLAAAELARSQSELRKKNEIMEDDLKMAREIQQAMLPQQYPTFPLGARREDSMLAFCHRYHPTGQVGGDFFNVVPLAQNKAGLFICDVMGHGVRSALVTAMVRALVEELRTIALDPGALLTRINHDLRAILQQTGTPLFTTAFYLVADLEKREIHFANAGHPRPFLLHADKSVEVLKSEDGKSFPALGLFQDTVYPTLYREIRGGDTVMLFTDGLYEVEAPDGEQFSQQMLFKAVQSHPGLNCRDLFDAILNDINKFSGSAEFADDVCLVGMEVSSKLK